MHSALVSGRSAIWTRSRLALLLGAGACLLRSAGAGEIVFGGYTWTVRSGHGGPGPNAWDERNVWLDAATNLHLRIACREGTWSCAEVSMRTRLGFGTYQFQTIGRLDRLDDNVVLGLFNYPTAEVGPDGTQEIDIEFARWGAANNPIGNFTVWPAERGFKQVSKAFPLALAEDAATHRFAWSPRRIVFRSLGGHRDDDDNPLAHWTYSPAEPARFIAHQPMPVHINLWLFQGQAPKNGQEVEVIIRDFRFTPAEWSFDRPGDLEGWRPNGHLVDVEVAGGMLHARGQGSDPILELTTPLDVPATARQAIELRLRADHPGTAEFFYSNTTAGRYGGFSQDKSVRFDVRGDGLWHTYRILPCWQNEGRIVRLRFDPYDAATFDIDFLRIVNLDPAASATRPEFDFPADAAAWQWIETVSAAPGAPATAEGLWLGPPVDFAAEERCCASLCLAVAPEAGSVSAALTFATTLAPGLHSRSFPLVADRRDHVYHLDLLGSAGWRGRVRVLGLSFARNAAPGDGAATPPPVAGLPPGITVRWLKLADEPQGPPQLEVPAFGPDTALPRARAPFVLRALARNAGGGTLPLPTARLDLPAGLVVEAGPLAEPGLATAGLGFGDEAGWTWTVRAERPVQGEAVVLVQAAGAGPVRARCRLDVSARPTEAQAASYVPVPRPVRGPVEVGVYYFPGWQGASQWQPIRRYPERRPVLGWYREGDPEVADWHIKWAVEHGITFFAYDWYWSQGNRQLEHALHDGFFRARYRHLLKFCLLWANHNAPGTSSPEDCAAVTRHWIAEYFHRPEYFRVDGRPVVIVFSTDRLGADLGGAGVPPAFDTMRRLCRAAGLKDLYLVACVGEPGQARQAGTEGYDAVTAYNWPGLGVPAGHLTAPFATLLPGYRDYWRRILELGRPTLWPPICGGWDSRPWHGDNNLVRSGRTPDLFRRHLRDARALLEPGGAPPDHAPAKVVLIEAWNEFGEGSYIEPHQEFGFGYLDAVREVFASAPAEHTDLAPADVGLGPYDVPPAPPSRTAWDFGDGGADWNNVMDLADVRVADGALGARTTGNDPAFFGPPFAARASAFAAVQLRLKLGARDGRPFRDRAQLFWRTSRLPESEAASERFDVVGDGQWHEYTVPVAPNPRWRGTITRLRLDPVNRRDVDVALDDIRLVPRGAGG
jgi:hypothetical protein